MSATPANPTKKSLRISGLIFVVLIAVITILGKGGGDAPPVGKSGDNAPTDIDLSVSAIDENTDTTGGVTVGTLTTTDQDAGDTFTYNIIGGTDAAVFAIGGAGSDELVIDDGVLDFETQSSYQVIVEVTDSGGLTYNETFTISVNDLNETPTDIDLSASAIDQNTDTTGGVTVGTLTTTDQDAGDTFTYNIIGGTDAAVFAIGGAGSDELVIDDGVLDFETQSSYQVIVEVTDSGGLTYNETLTIRSNCEGGCFPNGVAAGDVGQSSVVLWARASFEGAKVRFEYGRDPDFVLPPDGVEDVEVVTETYEDGSIYYVPSKVHITELLAGTQYYYRACRDSCPPALEQETEARGSFRTPHADGKHGLHFGVSSCFKGGMKPFVSIKNVPKKNLDFFVALGDTAYADSSDSGGQATTLPEFREKHELNYSQHNTPEDNLALTGLPIDDNYFALARGSTAFYVGIDDHEVVDNFAGGALPATHKQSANCKAIARGIPIDSEFLKNRCLSVCDLANDPNDNCGRQFINETDIYKFGLQAWHEYNPVRKERYGATGDDRTRGKNKLYRHRTFGKDAALFMLDARSFRDKERLLIGLGSSRTMLGKPQLTDLKRDLQTAQKNGITWKLVLVPEPIQNLDPLTAGDRFEGYDYERQEVLDFIETNCISNVVFISGDIHGTVANNLSYKKPPLFLQRFGSSWDISTGPGAYAEPLGRIVTKDATTTDRNALDGLFEQALNTYFHALRLPRTGLDPEQPADFFDGPPPLWQYRAEVDVTLNEGGYVAAHTYGWTEFEIDATTQVLKVTTHGIDWYEEPADADNGYDDDELNDLLAREPFIVSQFEVAPKFGCQGGKPNGTLCSDDAMCQSRLCNIGICTSRQPNGNICVRDEGCISELCNAGICTDPQPNGNVCVRDEGCISELCNAGFCTEPQSNGKACVKDEGCISGLCNAGICTDPQPNGNVCVKDEGCISGLCNAGFCTDPQPNGNVCVKDEGCISGLCNAGICTSRQPDGKVCVRDDGCQSDLCNAGICTSPQPDGNICVRDEGCISGLCNAGICTSPQPNGNVCLRDEGCQSGICNAGICTSRQPNGNVCLRDDGCISDLCNAGICTSPQANGSVCVRDDGCQSGLCNVGICMSPQANGSICVRDEACQSNLCNAGFCTSPQANGSICVRHDGCRSGLCDVGFCTAEFSKSFGTPCFSDRACISQNCTGVFVCGL